MKIALNLLSNKMKNRVRVQRDFCTDGNILCSGTQLTQVFLNVLDNAQQAVSGSGNIWIATRRANESLIVRIRDDGAGIPEDIQGRIFDPCFTTQEIGVGTGLGLSISNGIVKGHGGSVDNSSPPPGQETGTMITIFLPVAAEGADPPQDEASPSDAERTAKTDGRGPGRASQRTMKAMAGTAPGGRTAT